MIEREAQAFIRCNGLLGVVFHGIRSLPVCVGHHVANLAVQVTIGCRRIESFGCEHGVHEPSNVWWRIARELLLGDGRQAEPQFHAQLRENGPNLVLREHVYLPCTPN
jgi:hypothetical protein